MDREWEWWLFQKNWRRSYRRPLSAELTTAIFISTTIVPCPSAALNNSTATYPMPIRAYGWLLAMGAPGIATATDIAVLNNNYLGQQLKQIRGITIPLAKGRRRMEETVFSLKQMLDETGVGAHHFSLRVADYGPNSTFTLGYPPYIEEPWVIEPTETIDKDEIDHFIEIVRRVSDEAYSNPELDSPRSAKLRCRRDRHAGFRATRNHGVDLADV